MPDAFRGFDDMESATSIARQFALAKLNALRRAFGQKPDGQGPSSYLGNGTAAVATNVAD